MMADRLLSTYLNDHLATSTAAVELARRSAASNRGTPTGAQLEKLAAELAEERTLLQAAMGRLGVGTDRAKLTLAWTMEKLGRLKLNGRLFGYSPLSRVEELEFLTLGLEGKLLLWEALERAPVAARTGIAFEEQIQRSRAQLRMLRRLRLEAAEVAFGAGGQA